MKTIIQNIRAKLAEYSRYSATVRELQALSDRELADLGISRHSIREVARAA